MEGKEMHSNDEDVQPFLQPQKRPFLPVTEIIPGPAKALEKQIHYEMLIKTLAYEKIDDLKDAGDKSSQKWLLGRPLPWKPFVTAGVVTESNELHKGIAEYHIGGLLSLERIRICETTHLSAQSQK